MEIYPKITLTLLNGFLLVIPLFGLRYGIPTLVRKEALAKLAHFPPIVGSERIALNVYFLTNIFLVFSPLLAVIQSGSGFSRLGWGVYCAGLALTALSLLNFCTSADGIKRTGVYRFSRNPMYVGYFLIFIGVSFLIGSYVYLVITLIYQATVHFLILAEERWCRDIFGTEYVEYCRKVPRYL